jgi:tetratricopeptide (TPR) repeat protein
MRCSASQYCLRFALVGLLGLPKAHAATAQDLDDPPATIKAEDAVTEEQDDRIEASSLYAHGRMLLQRRDLPGALRRFERAWRFDPELVSIMEEIVPLAVTLQRNDEATRYAALAAMTQEVPPPLLERMAAILTQQQKFKEARQLYEKLLEAPPPNASSSAGLILEFEIARLSFLVGDFKASAEKFASVKEALEREGDEAIADEVRQQLLARPELTYRLMAESFLRDDQLDNAEDMFRKSDQAKPNPGVLGYQLAQVEQARGNRDKALDELDKYFDAKLTSSGIEPYLLLNELIDGKPKQSAEDDEAAAPKPPSDKLLQRLTELVDKDPDNPLLGYYLCDGLLRSGKLEQAEKQFKRLHEQGPSADGYRGLVSIYVQQQKPAPMLEQLGSLVFQTGSLDALGDVAQDVIGDQRIWKELQQLVQQGMEDKEVKLPNGSEMAASLLATEAKDADAAEKYMEAALAKPGIARGQFAVNYAFKMFQLEEPARAAAAFQRAIDDKLLPDRTAELSFYLSGALALDRKFDQALAAAEQAARLDPNSARFAGRVGWVLYQAEKIKEAEKVYLEVLEKYDGNHQSLEIRESVRDARMILSTIAVEQKRIGAAEEWLEQVLDEFPEDIGALNDLGYLWCDQGKHLKRSLAMIQKAVAEEPDNMAYRDSLGWAFYHLERYDEAVEELEKAAANETPDGVIFDHLADAYHKVGQTAKAVEYWQKALDELKDQDEERTKQIKEKIARQSNENP